MKIVVIFFSYNKTPLVLICGLQAQLNITIYLIAQATSFHTHKVLKCLITLEQRNIIG